MTRTTLLAGLLVALAWLPAAALGLPPEAKPIPAGTAAAVLSIGAAADQWSTGWALERGAGREVNPLGANVEQRAALQLAFVGAGALVVHEVSKRDRKKGRLLLAALVAVKVGAAGWNVHQGLKARR